MKPKIYLIISLIILLSVIIGCTKDNPELDSKVVLDEYLNLQTSSGLAESVYNSNKQIALTDGVFKTYLEKRYERERLISKYLDDFSFKCIEISTDELCDIANEELKEAYNYEYKIEVTGSEFKELNDAQVMWIISRRYEGSDNSGFEEVKYTLTKTSQNWLITDFVDSDGKKVSENIDERINESEFRINNDKETINYLYDFAEKSKNDKCILIQYNKKLTSSEIQDQKQLCYMSKYVDFVQEKNDLIICNEVNDPYYSGLCYGKISTIENDLSICDNMVNQEYGAKGLNEVANSKDFCYYYHSYILLENQIESCNKIINPQTKKDCFDIY